MVVHLAAANNDKAHDAAIFEAVNVDLTIQLAARTKAAKVPVFINVSTFHALGASTRHAYGLSKRRAAEAIRKMDGITVVTAYLPLVHASPSFSESDNTGLHGQPVDCWTGSARFLNRIPKNAAVLMFAALSALKPTVHIGRLADWIHAGAKEDLNGRVFLADDQSRNRLYSLSAQIMNWLAVGVAIFFLWWLYVVIWLAVRMTSKGPGVFAQIRVGKDGRLFMCYKFRTMRMGTPDLATHKVDGAQITGLGQILRKTKIDELPQLWNVARGQMSLVGPRPCLPGQTELVELRRKHGILEVRPGITGYAQVNGVTMQDTTKLVEFDLLGIRSRSLVTMISTLIRTLLPNRASL